MANDKEAQHEKKNDAKPESNANSQPMPDEYSNTANHKGAVDLGTDGTKATASQQQGQGAWDPKDNDDNRNGSRKSGNGQGGSNSTGE
ncbi:hypothetical protein [Pontibacter pamirensis]|uniref:hypothetical protein n=1 Tax=Pontibacter pamirensis TaxID=2562824 RepID=UPI001389A940|nr:hypothetical protein [Pontibacter pamirensis]